MKMRSHGLPRSYSTSWTIWPQDGQPSLIGLYILPGLAITEAVQSLLNTRTKLVLGSTCMSPLTGSNAHVEVQI